MLGHERRTPGESMPVSLRRLGSDVLGYGLGVGLTRMLGIAVALIYPYLLDRAEYGSVDVVFSLTAVLSYVLLLGLDVGVTRLYYESQDSVYRRRLVSTVFYVIMLFTLLVVGSLLVFARQLAALFSSDPRYIVYLPLAFVGVPFSILHSLQLLVLRLERRVRTFNLLATANLILSAVFGVTCIVVLKMRADGVLVAVAAGYAVTSIAGLVINWDHFWRAPLPGALRPMLALGLPLIFSNLAIWVLQFVDRLFLVHMVTADDVGLYAIANGIVGVLALALTAFSNAWQPFAFSVMGQERSESVYARTLTFLTLIGATLVVGGALFAHEGLVLISILTHKDWVAAAPSVGPLALGTVFYAMYLVVQTAAYITKRTAVIALTMGLAAAVNVALNLLWIPVWGITGAALATACGYFTALAVLYVLAQRLAHIPYELTKVMTTVAAACAVAFVAPCIVTGALWSDLLIKLLLMLSYLGILGLAHVIRPAELGLLWGMARRRVPFLRPQAPEKHA